MRTVFWDYEKHLLLMIDQRILPGDFKLVSYDDYQEVAKAISDMVVRGAPAIGAAAGFGMALAAQQANSRSVKEMLSNLDIAASVLESSRPTAVNLIWALKRIKKCAIDKKNSVDEIRFAVLREAQKIADEDVIINQQMARYGAELIKDGDTIIHHYNTGALATVDWGTALGVIRMAHEQGKEIHVLVDETRPRLQGARLTAWELSQYGISYDIISDNAAGYFLSSGQVQIVFVGSDRTAANGDVANKIGTYMLALAAKDNGIPFYPVVPTSTIDLSLAHGELIPIEERNPDEVLNISVKGMQVAPKNATARNPAFDVTPHRLITGIVTENGIVYPPFEENLARAVKGGNL